MRGDADVGAVAVDAVDLPFRPEVDGLEGGHAGAVEGVEEAAVAEVGAADVQDGELVFAAVEFDECRAFADVEEFELVVGHLEFGDAAADDFQAGGFAEAVVEVGVVAVGGDGVVETFGFYVPQVEEFEGVGVAGEVGEEGVFADVEGGEPVHAAVEGGQCGAVFDAFEGGDLHVGAVDGLDLRGFFAGYSAVAVAVEVFDEVVPEAFVGEVDVLVRFMGFGGGEHGAEAHGKGNQAVK